MSPESVSKEVYAAFAEAFARAVTPEARKRVARDLDFWLSFTARKRVTADLPERLQRMRKRFEALAANFDLTYIPDTVVVKVSGDDRETWRMLTRGTDWFDPLPSEQATALVVKAALNERS